MKKTQDYGVIPYSKELLDCTAANPVCVKGYVSGPLFSG